jgi:propanol-preferring alcohol dehydrogenase
MVKHRFPVTDVFVFSGNEMERAFALEPGASWAGDFSDIPPMKPEAVIDTTPVWKPVPEALKNLSPGGRLVINAIRKEDADKKIMAEPDYPAHLWMEKKIKSVANVSRSDIRDLLALAAEMKIKPEVHVNVSSWLSTIVDKWCLKRVCYFRGK